MLWLPKGTERRLTCLGRSQQVELSISELHTPHADFTRVYEIIKKVADVWRDWALFPSKKPELRV